MDTKSNIIPETDFSKPDKVVFNFIQSAKNLLNHTDYNSKDLWEVIMFYTTLKFHPYDNHLHLLKQVIYVKEIEKTNFDKQTARVVTKAIKNLIPLGIWNLELRNMKWKICDFKIQQGTKKYYSLVHYESEAIDEI